MEKMGVTISSSLWALVYVKTRLMNNIGENEWAVLGDTEVYCREVNNYSHH